MSILLYVERSVKIRELQFIFDSMYEGGMPVVTEISRDPPGYPDRRLHCNYRYFMNQIHAYMRPRDYS